MNTITEDDARWLALLIDTEGCIIVRKATVKVSQHYCAWISVGNTSRALIERAKNIVGYGAVLKRFQRKRLPLSRVPVYYWQITSRQAEHVLRACYPYFIIKQRQARLAIYAQSLNQNRGGRKGEYSKGSQPVPPEVQVIREKLWMMCKQLNNHGNPDVSWVPQPGQIIQEKIPVSRKPYLTFVAYQLEQPELLSGGEICRMFGVPHRTGYRWAKRYLHEQDKRPQGTYDEFVFYQDSTGEMLTSAAIGQKFHVPAKTAYNWVRRYLENQSCFSCE